MDSDRMSEQRPKPKRLYAEVHLTLRQAEYLYRLVQPQAVAHPSNEVMRACLTKLSDAVLSFDAASPRAAT